MSYLSILWLVAANKSIPKRLSALIDDTLYHLDVKECLFFSGNVEPCISHKMKNELNKKNGHQNMHETLLIDNTMSKTVYSMFLFYFINHTYFTHRNNAKRTYARLHLTHAISNDGNLSSIQPIFQHGIGSIGVFYVIVCVIFGLCVMIKSQALNWINNIRTCNKRVLYSLQTFFVLPSAPNLPLPMVKWRIDHLVSFFFLLIHMQEESVFISVCSMLTQSKYEHDGVDSEVAHILNALNSFTTKHINYTKTKLDILWSLKINRIRILIWFAIGRAVNVNCVFVVVVAVCSVCIFCFEIFWNFEPCKNSYFARHSGPYVLVWQNDHRMRKCVMIYLTYLCGQFPSLIRILFTVLVVFNARPHFQRKLYIFTRIEYHTIVSFSSSPWLLFLLLSSSSLCLNRTGQHSWYFYRNTLLMLWLNWPNRVHKSTNERNRDILCITSSMIVCPLRQSRLRFNRDFNSISI